MIEVVEPEELIRSAKSSLGLSSDAGIGLDEGYLASAVRRLAGFLCPCSPTTLVRWMVESHRGLTEDETTFCERIEGVVETLVSIGDLLELREVALEGDEAKGTWLVAAPPSFVPRPSGGAFILGLSADEQTPLPCDLRARVVCSRAVRSIASDGGVSVESTLREFGFRELSINSWLRAPKKQSAIELLGAFNSRLSAQTRSGEVPDLLVLDGARLTRSYRRRWGPAGSLSGRYVVRRPQSFGADLWGYAELEDGHLVKLLDLPIPGDRWRGCDVAWRLQLAIDKLTGRPQEYRRSESERVRFDLFAPIPLWARRRLSNIGAEVEPDGCLMSFEINKADAGIEEQFLNDELYMSRSGD